MRKGRFPARTGPSFSLYLAPSTTLKECMLPHIACSSVPDGVKGYGPQAPLGTGPLAAATRQSRKSISAPTVYSTWFRFMRALYPTIRSAGPRRRRICSRPLRCCVDWL